MAFKKGNQLRKGVTPWNKGLTKNRDNRIKKQAGRMEGSNNPNWKGNSIKSLSSLHSWIARYKSKPLFCEKCNKKKPYDLANISGEYKRDVNDYKWICRSCHMNEDGRMIELVKNAEIFRDKIMKRTEKKRKLAKSLRDEGFSYRSISEKIGYRGRSSVYGLLSKNGDVGIIKSLLAP